ncbi:hypothetical protein [Streptomyces sp. 2A115]|uniref:hypothetical protein n=1 Tax=Streptomyces sp. 2A115 TaxID=3457439 RepID=UPI003FD2BF48
MTVTVPNYRGPARPESAAQSPGWPKGVVGRYLTDAGKALSDPTLTVDLIEQDDGVLARCTTCPDSEWKVPFDPASTGGRATGWATREAGQWAQRHAETCQAMRPTAAEQRALLEHRSRVLSNSPRGQPN